MIFLKILIFLWACPSAAAHPNFPVNQRSIPRGRFGSTLRWNCGKAMPALPKKRARGERDLRKKGILRKNPPFYVNNVVRTTLFYTYLFPKSV